MLDGILDLLLSVIVLGIVVSMAFGFILPLMNNDVMQYDAKYEDKAVMGSTNTYSDETDMGIISADREDVVYKKRTYSYEELILMLAVQDDRQGGTNTIYLNDLETKNWIGNDQSNLVQEFTNFSIYVYGSDYLIFSGYYDSMANKLCSLFNSSGDVLTQYNSKYSVSYRFPSKTEKAMFIVNKEED